MLSTRIKLISQLRIGEVFKFPAIKMNSQLTDNYMAYRDFKKWNSENNKTIINTSNLCTDLYENYSIFRATFDKRFKLFDTDIGNYDTYSCNNENNHLFKHKIVSSDDKFFLFQISNTDDFNIPYFFMKSFHRFDIINCNADKNFIVRDINYKDDGSKLIKCLIESTHSIHYFNTKYSDITTALNVEIVYLKINPSTMKCILTDTYQREPIVTYPFKLN